MERSICAELYDGHKRHVVNTTVVIIIVTSSSEQPLDDFIIDINI